MHHVFEDFNHGVSMVPQLTLDISEQRPGAKLHRDVVDMFSRYKSTSATPPLLSSPGAGDLPM